MVPSAPLNLRSLLVTATQINLQWSASAGASSYVVERSLDGQDWSAVATNVASPFFSDGGLAYATSYYFRVVAVSSGSSSAPSAVVSAETGAQPDVLSMQPLLIHATRRSAYSGPVASFTDLNHSTGAGQFIATINWGDGVVTTGIITGGSGTFTVGGTHTYGAKGSFVIQVNLSVPGPDYASAATASTADVGLPWKRVVHARRRPSHRAVKTRHAQAIRRRG
jgi:hypothetical protein